MADADLIGRTFGRLTVIALAPMRPNWNHFVKCRCSCGTEKEIRVVYLRSGHTASCGCLSQESRIARRPNLKHGGCPKAKATTEYAAWHSMKDRCRNPKNRKWRLYGGRGIAVCEKWSNSFEAFLADVGLKPDPKFSLDRIDTNGNYEPGNVRWADIYTQNRNRRKPNQEKQIEQRAN